MTRIVSAVLVLLGLAGCGSRVEQPERDIVLVPTESDTKIVNAIMRHIQDKWGESSVETPEIAQTLQPLELKSLSRLSGVKTHELADTFLPLCFDSVANREKTSLRVWAPNYMAYDKAMVMANLSNPNIGNVQLVYFFVNVGDRWDVSQEITIAIE